MVRAAKCVRELAPGQAALAAALVEGSVDGREIPPQSTILGGRRKGDVTSVSGCEDLNIVVSSGPAAGQDEPHFHVHIIPRRRDDGFDIPLPFSGSEMPDRTFLDAMAARIIAALRDPARRLGKLAAAS